MWVERQMSDPRMLCFSSGNLDLTGVDADLHAFSVRLSHSLLHVDRFTLEWG